MIGKSVDISMSTHLKDAGSLRAGLCYGTDDAKYVERDDQIQRSRTVNWPSRETQCISFQTVLHGGAIL